MVVSLPSLGLIYSLLLLAPGFFTYKTSKYVGKITKEVDNFDKAIYTVLGSGLSLSISISIVSVGTFAHQGQIWFPTAEEVEVVTLAGIYLLTIPTAFLNGYLIGYLFRWQVHQGDDIRNKSVWKLVAENSEEPTQVTVITSDGSEIWGEIYTVDLEPHGQDMFIRYPLKITRDKTGRIIDESELGEYVFVSENSISQIHYEGEVKV